MTATKNKSTPYQPVFPTQYPQGCKSCKNPDGCEKFVVKGSKADVCIFFCPKNPGKTTDGKPIYLGRLKEVQHEKPKEILKASDFPRGSSAYQERRPGSFLSLKVKN